MPTMTRVGHSPLRHGIPMQPPMSDFMAQTEAITAELRRMDFGVESLINQDRTLLEKHGAQDIGPAGVLGQIQHVVQISEFKL